MKNLFKKNQVIITALAIMIAIVWYLSYTDTDKEKQVASDNPLKQVANDPDDVYSTVGDTLSDTLLTVEDEIPEDSLVINQEQEIEKKDKEKEEKKQSEQKEEKKKEKQDGIAEGEDEIDVVDTKKEDAISVTDTGELEVDSEEEETSTPGEAVLANTTISANYFAGAKLQREQNRAREKETLMTMIENKELSDEIKKDAVNGMLNLTALMEKESKVELLLEAKGFDDVVVTMDDKSVEVIVNAPTITEQQVAQIESIVKRNTDAEAEDIVINPVVVEE